MLEIKRSFDCCCHLAARGRASGTRQRHHSSCHPRNYVGLCLEVRVCMLILVSPTLSFTFCINSGVLLFGSEPSTPTYMILMVRNQVKSWMCETISFIQFLCASVCWEVLSFSLCEDFWLSCSFSNRITLLLPLVLREGPDRPFQDCALRHSRPILVPC